MCGHARACAVAPASGVAYLLFVLRPAGNVEARSGRRRRVGLSALLRGRLAPCLRASGLKHCARLCKGAGRTGRVSAGRDFCGRRRRTTRAPWG
jgi:hypothetical protein